MPSWRLTTRLPVLRKGRFPSPQLEALRAGESMARGGKSQSRKKQNRPVSPSHQAQASGARLPSSACRGQLAPPPRWRGFFCFGLIVARGLIRSVIRGMARLLSWAALVLIYVLPICANALEFRRLR